MRGNLPSVTAALFQEIVSCPDPAVVGQALATARTLAGYISNQPAAEADWQGVVVRGLVHRAVTEVKANPDSMMGRCVRVFRFCRVLQGLYYMSIPAHIKNPKPQPNTPTQHPYTKQRLRPPPRLRGPRLRPRIHRRAPSRRPRRP